MLHTDQGKAIWEEDITVEKIYMANRGAPQYIRQTLTDHLFVKVP